MSEPAFQAPSTETMDQLLPNLEFIGLLSSNSVGAVYYASQKSLDRDVAVKVFCPTLSQDEEFRSRFVGSSSSMAGLRHPNLIGVYDSGTAGGMAYVVIEFVPGKSLSRSTHGHAIEFSQAMTIIRQVCDGLAYAHGRRIPHGYLSPHDILLNQKAAPKIGNFGFGLTVHTLPDLVVPTHFAAPEVLAGEEPTEASDLYSLAAIFYELITGNPYRPGGPRASELEDTPPAVDKIIERAGSSDPELRDMNPAEFYERLQQASRSQPKLGTAAPRAAAAPRPPVPAVAAIEKEEKKILSKVVLILLLLIAIQQVWSHRGIVLNRETKSDDGAGAEEVTAVEVGQAPVIRRPPPPRPRTPTPPPEPPDLTGFPEQAETPMDSLERLRDRLAQGSREELPIGTVTVGANSYFLVTQAMSWPAAVAYAEQHGGHLALPSADMAWSQKEPIADQNIWLGAARSGATAFTRLDGKGWQPSSPLPGPAPCVHLVDGEFQTAAPTSTKPFVIEWRADGSQVATLEAQLTATAASLKGSRPIYPPGTIAVEGGRHYLPVARSSNWEEARKLAESGGGHLAVLSEEGELSHLQAAAASCPGSREFWTGGVLVGDNWQWVSAEPWRAVAWLNPAAAAEDGAAMLLKAGSGMDARDKSDKADGFLIEWSGDAESNQATTPVGPSLGDALVDLSAKADELVVKAHKDREAAHTKNTDKLAWDLDAHIRGLNKSGQQQWAAEAEKLKGCVRDNRLLKETIENEGVALSAFMAKLCNYLIGKQAEIDEQYTTDLQVIHASYRAKLVAFRDQAKEAGQIRTQLQAERLLENSENLDAWVASVAVE